MKMRNSDYFMEEKIFTFREFQKISYTKNKKIFFKLKKYIKDDNLEDDYEFFKITKDAIVPQNFVGTIPLDDIQIEILPKIPLVENNIEAEKIRFLEILQSIDYFKEKIFSNSKIEITDTSILEIFIHLFIEEVEKIIKKGLIYRYVDKNENFNVFKGKLDINNHIKKLKKISVNLKNKENLNKIGHDFENVSILDGSIENLKYLTFDRMNDYYKNAIQWAKIFLNNQSSSIFSTNNGEIPSILFPMETIFENYIANKLVNIIQEKSYNQLAIKVQDNSCSIFSSISLNNVKIDNNILRIRPDIVIKNKDAKEIFILDTKWKILNKLDDKFKISTEDVYQMLAYVKTYSDRNKNKYICKKAYLIYPATNMNQSTFFTKDDKLIFNTDDFELNIQFVDLSSEEGTEKSLINILNNFMKEGKRI